MVSCKFEKDIILCQRVVSRGQTTFSVFLWGGKRKGLVYSYYLFIIPHCGGGVIDSNVICYCFIVTHAIPLVLYVAKHISLKFIACVCYFNKWKMENSVYEHLTRETASSFSH